MTETSFDLQADTAVGAVEKISGESAVKRFVLCMARNHRTLQQNFTKLCFAWIQHCAGLQAGEFDGRNEASVKACKNIMAKVDKYDLYLPYI